MENRRNLCAQIPIPLHEMVRKEQEALNLTLSQYVERVLTEYYEQKEGQSSMNNNTRTLAFQIPEELFNRIQSYLDAQRQQTGQKITLKSFAIGLIEQVVEEWEAKSSSPVGGEKWEENSRSPVGGEEWEENSRSPVGGEDVE